MPNKFWIRFLVYRNGEAHEYLLSGRVAEALWYLVQVGEKGITALEMGGWAIRLASYVHDLRHDYQLDITTIREDHLGGFHARYRLVDAVEILDSGNATYFMQQL